MMESKWDKVEKLSKKIGEMVQGNDALLYLFFDGETEDVSGLMIAEDSGLLISAMCGCMDSPDRKGAAFRQMMMTTIIAYCSAHPEFATEFIQAYNKFVYGTDMF